jgi:hypothetical protein
VYLQSELLRVYVLKSEPCVDPMEVPPPGVILELERGILAFSGDEPDEVAFFVNLHALQVAYVIDGGTFDALYEDSEEGLAYWREVEQREDLEEMAEIAVNCTPGYEGQTVAL